MKRVLAGLLLVLLLTSVAVAAQAPGEGPLVDETLGQPAPLAGPAPAGAPVPFGGQEMTILDDFNRADGPIGPNWTVRDGYCDVSANAAVCGSFGRATINSAPGVGDVAEADVAVNGTNLQYTGLLLNYGAGVSNLFLKVQEQSPYAGQFTSAACYTGNNGTGFGLGFFALSSPFATAHMKATRVGDDVTIEFTNVDGGAQPSQTYVCTGAPAREGTGIGIMGYAGIARLDNFGVPGEPCWTHLFRTKINWQYTARPGYVKTVFSGIVHDQDHALVGGATVTGHWIINNVGQPPVTYVTTPTGQFKFPWKGPWAAPGWYDFCVDDIQYGDCFYDDYVNENPGCRYQNIPPPP